MQGMYDTGMSNPHPNFQMPNQAVIEGEKELMGYSEQLMAS